MAVSILPNAEMTTSTARKEATTPVPPASVRGVPRLFDPEPGAGPTHVHLLGAAGAGVSGVGLVLRARGVVVSGHDAAESPLLRPLRELDVPVSIGTSFASLLPPTADLVVRSAAVDANDPQVLAARERGVPVLKYADALAQLAPAHQTLAVAGTHGKTTASWMLWHVLEGIGEAIGAPLGGALIGGLCQRLATNALAGTKDGWFCVEACEYDRTFLRLAPRAAIVTNVEEDHLDYYGTREAIHTAFARFVDGVASDGLVVLGREVPEEVEVAAGHTTVWRLGRELEVDLLSEDRGLFTFRLRGPGWATPEIDLAVPGSFNVENAALVLALAIGITARTTGRPPEDLLRGAAEGLQRFRGVARRFESWGKVGGVELVHDYAHHPTEVRVTLEAARRRFPGRSLHVLFQPHQHSRTARFLSEFAESLRFADRVVVADVYGARKHIDGERLAGAPELVLELSRRDVAAVAGGTLGESVDRFVSGLPADAAALILGAGDVELVREELVRKLALRSASERGARAQDHA